METQTARSIGKRLATAAGILLVCTSMCGAQILGGGLLGGGFSPGKLGPTIWLDAARGITLDTGVTTWADQSGNGNDVTQGTGANQPTVASNALNGLPVIRFDGSDDSLQSGAITLNQPVTIVVVGKFGGNSEMLVDGRAAPCYLYRSSGSVTQVYAGSAVSGANDDGAYHVFSCVFNGASSALYIDGSETTGDAGANNPSGLTVGSDRSGASYNVSGDVAEILVFPSALSASDRATVEAWLAGKYGL